MSACVFGSIAIEITGSGNCSDSSTIGLWKSQSVSPVRDALRPTTAAMSPASISSISSRLFACIWSSRPIRSFLPGRRVDHLLAGLRAARVDAHVGEVADVLVGHQLEHERGERLVVVGLALHGSPVFGCVPSTGGTSSGDGR